MNSKAEALKKKMAEGKKCKDCGSKKHMSGGCNDAPSKEKGDEREGKEEKEEEDE